MLVQEVPTIERFKEEIGDPTNTKYVRVSVIYEKIAGPNGIPVIDYKLYATAVNLELNVCLIRLTENIGSCVYVDKDELEKLHKVAKGRLAEVKKILKDFDPKEGVLYP